MSITHLFLKLVVEYLNCDLGRYETVLDEANPHISHEHSKQITNVHLEKLGGTKV